MLVSLKEVEKPSREEKEHIQNKTKLQKENLGAGYGAPNILANENAAGRP